MNDMSDRERRYWDAIYALWFERLTDGSALAKDGRTPEEVAAVFADNAVRNARHYGYPKGS